MNPYKKQCQDDMAKTLRLNNAYIENQRRQQDAVVTVLLILAAIIFASQVWFGCATEDGTPLRGRISRMDWRLR